MTMLFQGNIPTTHPDIISSTRGATDLNIPTQIIHNTSIPTAIGLSDLLLYNVGQTVFFTRCWRSILVLPQNIRNCQT